MSQDCLCQDQKLVEEERMDGVCIAWTIISFIKRSHEQLMLLFFLSLQSLHQLFLTFSVSMCTTSFASGFSSQSGGPDGSFRNATIDCRREAWNRTRRKKICQGCKTRLLTLYIFCIRFINVECFLISLSPVQGIYTQTQNTQK